MADGSKQHDSVIKIGTSLEDAKRELKEAWRDCRPSCASADQLFHYTSAEGLYGLLKNKTLWLSNVSTFNDTSEMRYGLGVVKEALASQPGARNSTLNLKAAAEKGSHLLSASYRVPMPSVSARSMTAYASGGHTVEQAPVLK